MNSPPFRGILVMGCSRSGTTLLQSLFASHSQIHTFPETGVFLKAFGMRGTVLPWVHLGLTAGKERKSLAKLLASQEGAPGPLPPLPPRRWLISRSLGDVADFFDALAEAHGKAVWLEKTPRHVFHARRIGRTVPGVLCIHLVRKGEDVVASIVDRARRYPDRFPRQADPSYGVRQWNQSIRATKSALSDPGHVLVSYEQLVKELDPTLRGLCETVGLEFEPGMLSPADLRSFAEEEEEWKASVGGPVKKAQSKFERVFDKNVREKIERQLNSEVLKRLAVRPD